MKRPLLHNGIAIMLGCWAVAVLALYMTQYRGVIGIVLRKFGLS